MSVKVRLESSHLSLTFFSEVIDLTNLVNVDLFRKWDQKEVAYVEQLRFIRIASGSPETISLSRPGKHPSLRMTDSLKNQEHRIIQDTEADTAPLLLEPITRFSSDMMTMDGPI